MSAFDAIPADLRERPAAGRLAMNALHELSRLPNWVNWDGGKVPLIAGTGNPAKANDPTTWRSYHEALSADSDRIGFEFASPYSGIDLDYCRDPDTGEVTPEAQEILDRFDTYTELSDSGTGFHLICRSGLPPRTGVKGALWSCEVEVYSQGRFFVWTGKQYGDRAEIKDCQAALEALEREVKQAARKAKDDGGTVLGIGQGRNNELARLLGIWVNRGLTGEPLRLKAHELNNEGRFDPPLDDDEVDKVWRSADKWERGEGEPLVHEAAHAAVLAETWRGRYRWAQHEGTWRCWTGKVWKAIAEPAVVSAAQGELRVAYGFALADGHPAAEDKRLRTLHTESCRQSSVLGGLAFLKGMDGFFTEFAEWDHGAYDLNCADGILNLQTQELRPHDPAALCTRMVRWSYGETATTGAWERHLALCLPERDARRQVQRDLGRALVDAVLEHSLPIWHGVGRNGKSTTQDALQKGLDGYAKQAAKNLLMASKYERHTTEIADLAGARIVFSEEIEADKDLDEQQVKKLTGGGPQKARFMRQDFFEFPQTFSIFLLTNHHPIVKGTDRAIWARLRLVPWTVSIAREQQRPQEEVVAELVADGSWMLRWMVEGFADWQGDHYWVAESVAAATDAYRREQDRLAGFLADECEVRAFAEAEVGELHAAYTSWCVTAGESSLGKIAFGKALAERGFEQRKAAQGKRVWVGLRLSVASGGKNPGLFRRDDSLKELPKELPLNATFIRDKQAKEAHNNTAVDDG